MERLVLSTLWSIAVLLLLNLVMIFKGNASVILKLDNCHIRPDFMNGMERYEIYCEPRSHSLLH